MSSPPSGGSGSFAPPRPAAPNPLSMSPGEFACWASQGRWLMYRHLDLLNERMYAVAGGAIRRQATFMPPRHGKSLFRSMWFPAWYLNKFPDRRVILASYNAEYAAEWGMKVRDLVEGMPGRFRIKVRPDRRASDNWGILGHEGGMQTCGVGGSLTGRGADLMLIDDPVKDADEAGSPTLRQRAWDWYASAADTRLEPGGAICLTMTPWHGDDLGGRILEREEGLWDVLRLPALPDAPVDAAKRAERKGYDSLVGAPDPMGRVEGEPLCPERYDRAFFDRKRQQDPFWFDALFNCSPRSREGNMFKRHWFEGEGKVIAVPRREVEKRVRYWDTAASDGSGDHTVGCLMSAWNGTFYVEHVERFRLGPGDRDARIKAVATRDAERYGHVETWIEQGGGGGGKTEAAGLIKNLAGVHVQVETQHTNKFSRAVPLASQCEAGNVKLVSGKWNEEFLEELTSFRGEGKKEVDDQVDAASGAFKQVALGATPGGYATVGQDEYAEYEMAEGGYR